MGMAAKKAPKAAAKAVMKKAPKAAAKPASKPGKAGVAAGAEKLGITGAKEQQALAKGLSSGGMAVIKKAAAVGSWKAAAEQARKKNPTDKYQASLEAKRIYSALRRANK